MELASLALILRILWRITEMVEMDEMDEQELLKELIDEQRKEYWNAVRDNNPDAFEDF